MTFDETSLLRLITFLCTHVIYLICFLLSVIYFPVGVLYLLMLLLLLTIIDVVLHFFRVDFRHMSQRTIRPSNTSIAEVFFWSAQKMLYLVVFPLNTFRWQWYWFFPRQQDHFRYIIMSSMAVFLRKHDI